MNPLHLKSEIKQLDPRKGGYHYLFVDKKVVEELPKKNKTRLRCTLNDYTFPCGLNHLGDGNFFIILGKEKMAKSHSQTNDHVEFNIIEDPNPLGVALPEVLEVFLAQDPMAEKAYNTLTDGKKRSLIFSLMKTKNVDLQVQKIITFLETQSLWKT